MFARPPQAVSASFIQNPAELVEKISKWRNAVESILPENTI